MYTCLQLQYFTMKIIYRNEMKTKRPQCCMIRFPYRQSSFHFVVYSFGNCFQMRLHRAQLTRNGCMNRQPCDVHLLSGSNPLSQQRNGVKINRAAAVLMMPMVMVVIHREPIDQSMLSAKYHRSGRPAPDQSNGLNYTLYQYLIISRPRFCRLDGVCLQHCLLSHTHNRRSGAHRNSHTHPVHIPIQCVRARIASVF